MTQDCWLYQKSRLIDRFGERNFSKEFSLLCSLECKSIPDQPFVDIVNFMIGSRIPNKPPLLADFRDARLAYEKRKFEQDAFGAARAMREPARFEGLKSYLARAFPGCKTLNQAVEVRRLEIQIEKAKNSKYEPMKDPKWMGEHT